MRKPEEMKVITPEPWPLTVKMDDMTDPLKHLDHPLVAVCSIAHQLLLLLVSKWDMNPSNIKIHVFYFPQRCFLSLNSYYHINISAFFSSMNRCDWLMTGWAHRSPAAPGEKRRKLYQLYLINFHNHKKTEQRITRCTNLNRLCCCPPVTGFTPNCFAWLIAAFYICCVL